MLIGTIQSILFGESEWLTAWSISEKRSVLYNNIASLLEHAKNNKFEPNLVILHFSRYSRGVGTDPSMIEHIGRFRAIAVIKLSDHAKIIEIWNKNYWPVEEQKKAIWPIVDDVMRQVYGRSQ